MIEIKPTNPVEGDNVSITVSGTVFNCIPTPAANPFTLINNDPIFTIDFNCVPNGFAVPIPNLEYSREFQLGILPAGEYNIFHTVTGNIPQIPTEQRAFNIAVVKNVPTVSPLGLVLLSALLLIMGKRYFKRKS